MSRSASSHQGAIDERAGVPEHDRQGRGTRDRPLPVIGRCLQAVKPLIDTWVIVVDTGSTDGTQALIRSLPGDVPGHLHERPWRNFGHNRSEAILLARGAADYLLFLDADDILEAPPAYAWPTLDLDAYELPIVHSDLRYRRIALVREALG